MLIVGKARETPQVTQDYGDSKPPTRLSGAVMAENLEQAWTAVEDARDEVTRLALELDRVEGLLEQKSRDLERLQHELGVRNAVVDALLRQFNEDTGRDQSAEAIVAEELQVLIEELRASNDELVRANEDLECQVTERRLAEEALRENEGRLAAIFAQAEVGLSEIGLDGRFRRVNDRLCAMLGRAPHELLGIGVQDVTHPDDLARTLPLFVNLVETGEVISIEKRYRRPDGTHFWAVSSVSQIRGSAGEPLGVIAVTVDLTERRLAEDTVREARDAAVRAQARAEEANRAKSPFLASVSHDLRQPVTAANLFLDLLRKRPLGPAECALVEPLASSIDSLTGMLNGLLQVARLEAGIIKAEPRVFPLDALFRRLFAEFQPAARTAGLRLHVPPVSLSVRSDPLLVELVLRNLLSNAIKYTPAGSVSVLAAVRGEGVVLEVTDTGQGIAAADMERIFEEYYQAAGTVRDHSRGFGIGLATARRVAALLGTRIAVRSEVGAGSTFSLSLSLADHAGAAAITPHAAQSGALADLSAVVIDDEPLVLQALELLLGSWGMRVHAVRTLERMQALLAKLDRPPDVVIADYSLAHGERGTDAVALARRRGAPAAILLTGDTSPERLAEARRSDCHLLHKPVTAELLQALLNDIYDKSDPGQTDGDRA